jgi:hypothetical protein
MTAIITNAFRAENLKAFMQSVDTDAYFLFIGKPLAWTDEASPDSPVDSQSAVTSIWNQALAAKKINLDNLRHGIFLRVWTSGKYYDMYRHDYNNSIQGVNIDTGSATTPDTLFEANYYVVDDVTLNVYKCLYNRAQATNLPIASTDKPSGTGSGVIVTSDGYRWKYMFTVPSGDAALFNTPSFIPAPAVGASTLNDGGIYSYRVTAGGSGYSGTPTVVITGDGTGATATAIVTSNVVTAVNFSAAGSGYRNAKVAFTGGGGTGAAATPIISPIGGHGSKPAEELGGIYVIIQTKLEAEEAGSKFTVANDYRQLGIVKNPVKYIAGGVSGQVGVEADGSGNATTKVLGDGTAFNSEVDVGDLIHIVNPSEGTEAYLVVSSITDDEELYTENVPAAGAIDLTPNAGTIVPYDYEVIPGSFATLLLSKSLTFTGALTGTGVLAPDSTITGGTSGAVAKVVDWDNTNKIARYILDYSISGNNVDFQVGETVSDGAGQSGTVASGGVDPAEVVPLSGQVIYYENRRLVNRSADQTEDCRLVIEF